MSRVIQERESAPVNGDPPASRQHFDVWQFGSDGGGSSYFGKMPPQVVENLLWTYTEPGQVVFEHAVADQLGLPRTTVQGWLGDKRKSADFANAPPSRQLLKL